MTPTSASFPPLLIWFLSQLSSVAQSCPTLCDPTDCSTPGFPVHHHLPEFAQTHVHWVSDAIQLTHPLLSTSPAFNLSQHQGLSNESVLQIRWPKHWSFNFSISPSSECSGLIFFRIDCLISLLPKGLSRVFFITIKNINSSTLSLLYSPILKSIHVYWKNHSFDYMGLCWQNDVFVF